jgi:cell division protein FtsA
MSVVASSTVSGKKITQVMTVLDIGTTKYLCAHGRFQDNALEVFAQAQSKATGISQQGALVDIDGFENAILKTVEAVEHKSNFSVGRISIGLSSPLVMNKIIKINLVLDSEIVEQQHVELLFDSLDRHVTKNNKKLLYFVPQYYLADGVIVLDPRGMRIKRLSCSFMVTVADPKLVDLIYNIFERCRLPIGKIFSSSYASAVGNLVRDEMLFGVGHIDLGGKSTDISVFKDGNLTQIFSLPVGAHDITVDISKGLGISVREAERIKALYGSLLHERGDENKVLDMQNVEGMMASRRVTKNHLINIIRGRLDEILDTIANELKIGGLSADQRYVITGGASVMPGLKDRVALKLKAPVRIGYPLYVSGNEKKVAVGPEFSTCAGLFILTRNAALTTQIKTSKKSKGFLFWDKLKSIIYDAT